MLKTFLSAHAAVRPENNGSLVHLLFDCRYALSARTRMVSGLRFKTNRVG
jgi:hypothetical protein